MVVLSLSETSFMGEIIGMITAALVPANITAIRVDV